MVSVPFAGPVADGGKGDVDGAGQSRRKKVWSDRTVIGAARIRWRRRCLRLEDYRFPSW